LDSQLWSNSNYVETIIDAEVRAKRRVSVRHENKEEEKQKNSLALPVYFTSTGGFGFLTNANEG